DIRIATKRRKIHKENFSLLVADSTSLLRARFDFFDTSGFATKLADVIQLRAAHAAGSHNFDFIDHFRVQRKDSLDAMSKRNLAHREGRAISAMFLSDADAFENLDAFFVAFLDFHMDFHGIARLEIWNIRP